MDNLFDGVEIFFNSIKEKCSSSEEYAAEILKARGFLLEDAELALSDNSHKDDAAYLNKLLTEANLGEVTDGKIFIRPGANVEEIFYKNNFIGFEVFRYPESWKKFVHNSFAPKVFVRYLEPFVARYVKAVSACGVETWLSCDGNHPNVNKIMVACTDVSSLWHEIICKRLLDKRFKFDWNSKYSEIKFNKTTKWQTYAELNRAAEFLYNNRTKIRNIRRDAANGISTDMARNLSSEELAKIFSERANKLFDDFVI